MLRKILSCFIILCIVLSLAGVFALANAEWSARVDVEQTTPVAVDSMISVRISIEDITSESGIICAIYSLAFDSTCLEYISHVNGLPREWELGDENSLAAEDWSQLITVDGVEPYFYYTLLNDSGENGVTEDGVLYTELTFRVIDPSVTQTKITISEISLTDEEGLYQNYSLELADISYTLNLLEETTDDESMDESSFDGSGSNSPEESQEVSEPDLFEQTEIVSTEILLYDIKDPNGISAVEFDFSFDPSVLEFVKYEFIRPSIWVDDVVYTEDFTNIQGASNGQIHFCVLNCDENCGVKEDGILGFRLYFKATKGTTLDESYFKIDNEIILNTLVEEIDSANYKFAIGMQFSSPSYSHADIKFDSKDGNAYELQFSITFDSRLCEFVEYEFLFGDGSSAAMIDDQSVIDEASAGKLFFRLVSLDQKTSITKAGVVGIRIYFEMKNGIQFDPSLISDPIDLIAKNVSGEPVAFEAIVEGKEEESFWDVTKVTIMVVSSLIVVLAGVLVVFVYGRKKKKQ